MCVRENQILEKNLAGGCTKKGVMLILGYNYPNDWEYDLLIIFYITISAIIKIEERITLLRGEPPIV
jgi:hypothetical protein